MRDWIPNVQVVADRFHVMAQIIRNWMPKRSERRDR
ncbi:hypothetical protein [Microcoleus sp. Pol11C2]